MKKLIIILVFISPFIPTAAQNLDSLYNAFLSVKGLIQSGVQQNVALETEPTKCSFGIVNQVKLNYDKFSPIQKAALINLLQRPTSDTSFVSPRGHFRIHYKKTGVDSPGYDLNLLAQAADSSYSYEVKVLGFPPPPKDLGEGGDDLYDIYILNLSSDYGYTEFDKALTPDTYTSYMVMDNDFSGSNYYTHGIDAARVTVAHELHHAIQIGNYIYRDSDNFYYELTSTAMEEFVYDSINDYYFYMSSYFRNPQRALSSNDGYNTAVWNIYLRDRFGVGIIKRIWELMPKNRAIESISAAIQEQQSFFKVEFNKFALWNYFTGSRAVSGKYYGEAANYPLINPTSITNLMTVNSEAVSNSYFLFNDNSNSAGNNIVSIISNCDAAGGIKSPPTTTSYTFSIAPQSIAGGKNIISNYYTKLESTVNPSLSIFSQSYILNGSPVNEGNIIADETDYAFPQPFKYSLGSEIFFPVSLNGSGVADLNIYSVNMNLVYSGTKRIVATDKISVGWDARDSRGKKVATGIYLYVTKSGDKIKKGKFVIYND
ncbi:MAG: hypothetical protein CVV24_05350 [Ignavibacteriae bacterium HGW-Ignavibacteriae-3]|nr:MAG: hypothetical protein CVV24_05350 [Ignavibacteriae bacterium HGW-Ignavibacteriae-3]